MNYELKVPVVCGVVLFVNVSRNEAGQSDERGHDESAHQVYEAVLKLQDTVDVRHFGFELLDVHVRPGLHVRPKGLRVCARPRVRGCACVGVRVRAPANH